MLRITTAGATLLPLLSSSGCVTVVTAESSALSGAPAIEEATAQPGAEGAPQAFVGVELEEALSGSLEAMEFMGGLRVASVAAGSPAEAAGIRAGDRVVEAGRAGERPVQLERLDQWAALLAQSNPGDELVLSVERGGGVASHFLRAAARGAGARPPARRFLERRKARCVVETELADVDGRRRSVARLVELAPSSPLRAAGLSEGARILALDGAELAGAADFARRVSALPWGARVELDVEDERGRRTVRAKLWEPERHLTAFELWPLLAWAESPDESRAAFELLDLWLIWLVKYEREGGTSRTSILRLIEWETGAGALTEEPAAASAAAGSAPAAAAAAGGAR
jgi:membrane-associated protease RseP (regulator of RpoE activity)